MRLKSSLLCRTIVWLAIPVLLAQGCATSGPTPLQRSQPLGTIGVVSATVIPEADAPEATSKAEAGTQGAMVGLGKGLAGAVMCALGALAAPYGGGALLEGCIWAVGTPVLMVAGAGAGSKAWIPEEVEQQAKAVLNDSLTQGKLQRVFKDHVIKAGQDQARHQFTPIEEDVANIIDEQADYRHLASRGIDTVFEVSLANLGFVKGEPEEVTMTTEKVDETGEDKYENMPFSLTMAARARLIRVSDNEPLSVGTSHFTSPERKWSKWVKPGDCPANEPCSVSTGQAFSEAIGDGHHALARQIVDELFAAPVSPGKTGPIERIPHQVFDGQTIKGLGAPEVKVRLATRPQVPQFWRGVQIAKALNKMDFANRLHASVERRFDDPNMKSGKGSPLLEIEILRYGFVSGPKSYVQVGTQSDKSARFCLAIRANVTLKVADQVRYKDIVLWEPYKRSTDVPPPSCDSLSDLADKEGKRAQQVLEEAAEILAAVIVGRLK